MSWRLGHGTPQEPGRLADAELPRSTSPQPATLCRVSIPFQNPAKSLDSLTIVERCLHIDFAFFREREYGWLQQHPLQKPITAATFESALRSHTENNQMFKSTLKLIEWVIRHY